MALKIEFQRKRASKSAIDPLIAHLDYLSDPTHDDHANMVLMPGTNYHCDGTTAANFVNAVIAAEQTYRETRRGLPGKCSPILWEEIIYSPEKGSFITEAERQRIEKMIVDQLAPDSTARCTWHVDPINGHDDLHVLIAAKTRKGKLTLARTNVGQSKILRHLDQKFANILNSNRKKPKKRVSKIYSAAEVAQEKSREAAAKSGRPTPLPLAKQVANLTDDEVTSDMLPSLLRKLGIEIKRITEATIEYISSRTRSNGKVRIPRKGTIRIKEFLLQVLEIQVDRRLKRAKSAPEPTQIGDSETDFKIVEPTPEKPNSEPTPEEPNTEPIPKKPNTDPEIE